MPQRAPVAVLALLGVLASICLVASQAEKEFADCGSSALMPLKLELDPDPAEVFGHAMPPHKATAPGRAVMLVTGGASQAYRAAQQSRSSKGAA